MLNTRNISRWDLISVILLTSVSFALYLNTLTNEFVFDDLHFIINNRWISDWRNIGEIFFSPVFSSLPADQISKSDPNFYRPVYHLFLMLGYLISGLEPWGYRLINISLHAGNGIIVFFITKKILREMTAKDEGAFTVNPLITLLPAMIFIVHPVQAEMIAWASGSNHLGLAFFFLLSLYLYMEEKIYLSAFIFFIAVFNKETAVMLPVLLFCYDIVVRKRPVAPVTFWIKRFLPFALSFAAYFAMRLYSLGGMIPTKTERIITPFQYVVNLLPLLAKFIKKLILPTDITFYVYQMSVPFESIWDIRAILLLALFILLTIIAIKIRKSRPRILFCLLWIFLPLLPVMFFGWVQGAPVYSDRFLYIPCAGYSVLIGLLVFIAIGKLNKKGEAAGETGSTYNLMKRAVTVAIIVALAFLSIATIKRTFVWRDQLTLIEDTLKKTPNYGLFRFLYAKELSKRGRIDEAIRELKTAIKADKSNALLHNNLGVLYSKKNLISDAKAEFEIAVRLKPQYEMAKKNLKKAQIILKENPASNNLAPNR